MNVQRMDQSAQNVQLESSFTPAPTTASSINVSIAIRTISIRRPKLRALTQEFAKDAMAPSQIAKFAPMTPLTVHNAKIIPSFGALTAPMLTLRSVCHAFLPNCTGKAVSQILKRFGAKIYCILLKRTMQEMCRPFPWLPALRERRVCLPGVRSRQLSLC